MSNDPEAPGEHAHLEPLPDLPPEVPHGAPAAAVPPPPPSTPRGQRVLPNPATLAARAQEKAPQLLKKASWLLVAGSLLPWMGPLPGNQWMISLGIKAVMLLGCWLLVQGVLAHFDAPTTVSFGRKALAPGKKGIAGALTGLHVVGIVCILASFVIGIVMLDKLLALGEAVTLLLGGITFAHIVSYEKGGRFNPLFPIMFLGCALGGLASLIGRVQAGHWLGALGCAVITGAGILAVYTIAVAMMQAKKDGDIKKAAALESRKSARSAGRASSAGREARP